MKRQKKDYNFENLKIVVVFAIFVVFLILGSLAIKFFSLYKKSSFDGEHKFTIVVSSPTFKNNVEVISIAPDTKSISVLTVSGKVTNSRIGSLLSIPIDGSVLLSDSFNNYTDVVKSNFQSMVFGYSKLNTNLTIIDFVRLWLFTASLPTHSITTKEISLVEDDKDLDEQRLIIDKVIPQIFTDYSLSKEQVSIQIVNATGINGIGNRLAKLLTNIGGNVVSVTTSDSISSDSSISYYGEKTYTAQKLNSFLNFPLKEMQNSTVSDIVIVLGKDKVDKILSKI